MTGPEYPISHDYCEARSGGIERVQRMAERRLDGHGQKIDDLTRACVQLTAAVDRVTRILEKQDQRLDRVENRNPFSYLETPGGKLLMLWSSFVPDGGYATSYATSAFGELRGPWIQREKTLYALDGAHSMLFYTFSGQLMMSLHCPNDHARKRILLSGMPNRSAKYFGQRFSAKFHVRPADL